MESLHEKAISSRVDKLIGNNDQVLNTIVKLALLNKTDQEILQQIKANNELEALLIEQELLLTYDSNANIIELNSINAQKTTIESPTKFITDSTSILSEPK